MGKKLLILGLMLVAISLFHSVPAFSDIVLSDFKNLYLEFKNSLRPRLTIPLEDINPVNARKILKNYLDEDLEKDTEPTSEALGRKLRL